MPKNIRYLLSVIVLILSTLFSGCFSGGDVPNASGDRVPPTISILGVETPHKTEAGEISGNIVIRVQAADNVGVAQVEIQFKDGGGQVKKTLTRTVPTTGSAQNGVYEITYNTADLLNATYTITAVAQDEKGFRTPVNYGTALVIKNNGPSIGIGDDIVEDGDVVTYPGPQDVKVLIPAGYDGIVYTFNGTTPTMGPPINSFNKTRLDGTGCSSINDACEVTIRVEKSAVLKVRAYKWNSETNEYEYSGETTITIIIEGTVMTPGVDVDGNGGGSGTYGPGDLDGEGYLNIQVTIPKDAHGIVYTKNTTEPNLSKNGSEYVIRDYLINCAKKTNDPNLNGFSGHTYTANPDPIESVCANDTSVTIRIKSTTTLKIKAYRWNGIGFDFSDTTTVEIIIEGTIPTPEIIIPDPDNPGTGTYDDPVTVVVTIPEGSDGIIYTINGTTPTLGNKHIEGQVPQNGVALFGVAGSTRNIELTTSCDFVLLAFKDTGYGYAYSENSRIRLVIEDTVFVPHVTPHPGHFITVQQVGLNSLNGTSIRYTIGDGSQAAPADCSSGTLYSSSIQIENEQVIKAIGCAGGLTASMASVVTYNVTAPIVDNIVPSMAPDSYNEAGTYTRAQTLTLSNTTSGAVIYYTTNGDTPVCGGTSGTSISLAAGTYPTANVKTVKAIACKTGWISSPVYSSTFTIYNQLAIPVFDTAGDMPGIYSHSAMPADIRLKSSQAEVELRYTIDGTTPNCTSTLYAGPLALNDTATVKALACKGNWAVSGILSGSYTIKLATPTGFTASDGESFTHVSISWNSVSGADQYEIFRDGTSLDSTASTSYNDTSADSGQAYSYYVVAKNTADDKYTSANSSADSGYRQLSAPTAIAATPKDAAADNITVTWSATGTYDKAVICRAMEDVAEKYSCDKFQFGTNPTSYEDKSALSNITYYYKVKLVNTVSGAESNLSTGNDWGKRIGNFSTLGDSGFGGGTSGVRYTSIMFYQGVPYVAYKDQGNSSIYAKYFDWKDAEWKNLGTNGLVGTNSQTYPMTSIYVHNENQVYVGYTNSSSKAVVKVFNGSSWSDLGSLDATTQGSYSFFTMHADVNGNPYIAYRASDDKIMVWTYQGGVWSKVGGSDATAGVVGTGSTSTGGSYMGLYVSGTTPYVVYMESGSSMRCKYLSGDTWTSFGDSFTVTYSYLYGYPYPKLFVDGSTVYIAHNDGSDMYVKQGTGGAWTNMGGKAVSGASSNISRNAMKVIDGRIYIGYQSGSTGYIKMYDGAAWSFVGGNNSPNFDNGIIGSMPSSEADSFISIDFAYGSVFAAFTDGSVSGKISVRY